MREDRDFDVFGLRDQVYFGRQADGVLENEFSGNLVEVCPTGVFTDKTLKQHYTRKWDLQMAPSVCVHCGLGCNTTPGERYGKLRQIVTRYNREVNGYFLCDRGRYGYEFVNSNRRIRQAALTRDKNISQHHQSRSDSTSRLSDCTRSTKLSGSALLGLRWSLTFSCERWLGPTVSTLASTIDQYPLGVDHARHSASWSMPSPSLREVELSDAVLILGEDVTNVAPRMALSLRQSVRQQPMQISDKMHIPRWDDHAVREALQDAKGPLFIASPAATRLDDVATRTYHAAPDDVARLGFAIAHLLDESAPAVPDLPADLQRTGRRDRAGTEEGTTATRDLRPQL